jgi:hypothetical protein
MALINYLKLINGGIIITTNVEKVALTPHSHTIKRGENLYKIVRLDLGIVLFLPVFVFQSLE